jgi:hypothetical protein
MSALAMRTRGPGVHFSVGGVAKASSTGKS